MEKVKFTQSAYPVLVLRALESGLRNYDEMQKYIQNRYKKLFCFFIFIWYILYKNSCFCFQAFHTIKNLGLNYSYVRNTYIFSDLFNSCF